MGAIAEYKLHAIKSMIMIRQIPILGIHCHYANYGSKIALIYIDDVCQPLPTL